MVEKNNTKASILIANYNNEKYIEECLNSILNQTYKNIEIIVIDDDSSDNSSKIINKFKDKIIIANKKDKKTKIGSYDQMLSYYNCLNLASGEIIFLCDSDDFFEKNKIELIMNKFFENKSYKIVLDLPLFKFENKIKVKKLRKRILNNYWPYLPPTSCISINRIFFKKIFHEIDIKKFPDIWLDFRLGVYSKFVLNNLVFVNKNLTYYRQTETNISSKFNYLSKNWWARRYQAHNYLKYFFEKNNIIHKKNFDFFLTSLVNKFLNE